MIKSILVNLQEGVSLESLLPVNRFKGKEGHAYTIERVHSPLGMDIKGGTEPLLNADERKVYDELSEEDKKIYRTFKIIVPDAVDAEKLVKELQKMKGVNYAQINGMNALTMSNNDPLISEMYSLRFMQCEDAWKFSSGEGVVVAVVDTGVDYNHPDISNNMWKDSNGKPGYNFSENNTDPMDHDSHGTHVAGIIAATGNNSIGISGVAFKAKIMALKVFPNAEDDVCARAIIYAADNGAHVINNSWVSDRIRLSNPEVEQAIDYAVRKNVLVVFGAGNNGRDVDLFAPANYPPVFCVAETDGADLVTQRSNFGANVSLAAPGEKIWSLKFNSDDYDRKSGTSMAAPQVAGVAALIIAQRPTITVSELKKKLVESVDVIQTHKPIGSGRINALKAVKIP